MGGDQGSEGDKEMKAKYVYGVHMPSIGLLTKTVAETEKESISLFAQFEPRLSWLEALEAGFKMKKLILVELS